MLVYGEVKVILKSAASRDSPKTVFLDIVPLDELESKISGAFLSKNLIGHVMLNKHRDVTVVYRHESVIDVVQEPGY